MEIENKGIPVTKKTKSIPNPYARKISLPCRMNQKEMKNALAKAHKYFEGNLSVLTRAAIAAYRPKVKKK